MGGQQLTSLAARQGHQEMMTETAPAESGAMAWNTEVSRSMTRPGFDASRSVTRQEAVAPVATLRTTTVVPMGNVGLAHCPFRQAYQVARPELLDIGRVVVGAGAAVVGVGVATRTAVVGVGAAASPDAGVGAGGAVVVVVEVVGTGIRLPTSMIRRRCRCW